MVDSIYAGQRRAGVAYESSCKGKRSYASRRGAKKAWKRFRGRSGRDGQNNVNDIEAYRCRFCGRWHLGHRAKKNGA